MVKENQQKQLVSMLKTNRNQIAVTISFIKNCNISLWKAKAIFETQDYFETKILF